MATGKWLCWYMIRGCRRRVYASNPNLLEVKMIHIYK